METYSLKSRIPAENKEFLIQTINDVEQGIINTSIFIDGELVDTDALPLSDESSQEQVINLVKSAHSEKKSELEYLLNSFREVLDSGQPRMLYHFGTTMFHKRMYTEAQRLFQTAIKLNDEYHEAYFYLSQTELALGNVKAAVTAGNRAVELRPNFADYRNNLGEAYLAGSSCKRAAIEFQQAIDKNVYYADAYFNLVLSHILNGLKREDFDMSTDMVGKCRDLLKKAILIYPEYKGSSFDEASTALSAGDYKQAFDVFLKIRDRKKEKVRQTKAAHFKRYLIYTEWLSEDNILERIEFLTKEIDKNPNYVDLSYELGMCYLHNAMFMWQRGAENFKKALGINPDLKKAQRALDLSEEHLLRITDTLTDITEKNE
jgi:tetratricopeptide (TPR) repeat protein